MGGDCELWWAMSFSYQPMFVIVVESEFWQIFKCTAIDKTLLILGCVGDFLGGRGKEARLGLNCNGNVSTLVSRSEYI